MENIRKLKNLMRIYRNRQCVLFVGAGFSAAAKSKDLEGREIFLPSSSKLIEYFQEKLKEENGDLSSLADLYMDENGEHGLYKLLKSFYVASSVTNEQEKICIFEWKEIYTTNYDNVIEICLENSGKRHAVYTPMKSPSDVDYRTLPVVHINGYMSPVNFEDFRKEIKLTNSQYFSDDFSRSPWGERFRNDIITSPCIIFAGYSLFDLDVARVLNTFEGMRERIFFILGKNPDRSLRKKLDQFGTVIDFGVDGFADLIDEVIKDTSTPKVDYLSAWEKISLPLPSSKSLRDIDVVNFMMSGSVDYEIFSSDVINKFYKYAINRKYSDRIVGGIENNSLSNVLIYSNAGNGKTTFLESLGCKLAARNFSVYRAASNSSLLLKEIPIIKEIDGKIIFLIDDAFSNIDAIKAIIFLGRKDIHVISTARTSQAELQEGEIRRSFNDNLDLYSLDHLEGDEVAECISFLDRYALWGPRQALLFDQKKKFIEEDCSGELRFVILEVLDSPVIKARIQQILDLKGNPETRDKVRSVLIVSQLLNLAQVRPDLTLISELVQFDARRAIAEHANQLRDFTLVRNGQITIRSSIFSDYIIKRLIDTPFVIETLVKIMRNLDIIHDNDKQYTILYKNFSRFAFIERAIAAEKRLIHMIKYFEDIKELSHSREHPLFWLQYAMCRMSLGHFPEAARLFEVAYAISKESGYRENRHLNNQWARFLLESRTSSNDYTDYMSAFNEAHRLCLKQMIGEPLSDNPYRVAQNYLPFLERRIADLKTGDFVGIIRSCAEVLKQASARIGRSGSNGTVDKCIISMKKTSVLASERISGVGGKL